VSPGRDERFVICQQTLSFDGCLLAWSEWQVDRPRGCPAHFKAIVGASSYPAWLACIIPAGAGLTNHRTVCYGHSWMGVAPREWQKPLAGRPSSLIAFLP
jgi:hypothetical protein